MLMIMIQRRSSYLLGLFFFLPNLTPGLSRSVEGFPTSLMTRVGNGFPLGLPLNFTVSPLLGPRVIFLVAIPPSLILLLRAVEILL